MALAIATNNAALRASAAASSVNRDMETSMARLSSGKRINSASDDAAGVAISSRLTANIRGTDQAIRNALDGQALIDTAEGAHKEIENILQRMLEVAVQAANDTNNKQDRANLQAEMDAMSVEINRIAGTTTWAGTNLIDQEGGADFSFQVGSDTGDKNQIDVVLNSMTSSELGLGDPSDNRGTVNLAYGLSSSSNAIQGQGSSTITVVPSGSGSHWIEMVASYDLSHEEMSQHGFGAAVNISNMTVSQASADVANYINEYTKFYGVTAIDTSDGSGNIDLTFGNSMVQPDNMDDEWNDYFSQFTVESSPNVNTLTFMIPTD